MLKIHSLYCIPCIVFANKTLASMDRTNAKLKAKATALNDSADKHAWGEK